MPELPDLESYLSALRSRVLEHPLDQIRIQSPAVLRSFDPPINVALGRRVLGLRRLGKRLVLELEGEFFLVLHLMIAGRLQWKEPGAKTASKIGLATFAFRSGTLLLTEASPKKRAQLHLLRGETALAAHDPGGLEVLQIDLDTFARALRRENHTLKRTLTDPQVFSGIGNAYSDEIFHRAGLSPVALTQRVSDDAVAVLFNATRAVLTEWIERLIQESKDRWPTRVTAFRPEMAVHGRHGLPCPTCATKIQRIVRATNEFNYCPQCQTGGRLLADRALSRLLKKDWPRTLEEMEEHLAARRAPKEEGD